MTDGDESDGEATDDGSPDDPSGEEGDGGPDAPASDDEVADAPATDDEVADAPATDDEVADAPATDDEVADAPATDDPASDDPATDDEVADDVRERIAADPFCGTLGIDLLDLGPGTATTELTVTDDLLNFHGVLHGGALNALADAAFAAASNAHGETALAVETNVSFLQAVDVGATLRARATETYRGDRTAEYEVVVSRVNDDAGDGGGDAAPPGDRVATFRGRVYLP